MLTDGLDDGTDGDSECRETKTGEETSNAGSELHQKEASVVADDVEDAVNMGSEVLQQVTDGASAGDDLTNGDTDSRETKTGDESSNLRAELDEKLLSILASNGQETLSSIARVADDLSFRALDVVTNSRDDRADGNANARESETLEETSDGRSKLNQVEPSISAGDSEEALDLGSDVLGEITGRAGGRNDGTDRDTDLRKSETADQVGHCRAELDEQVLRVLTGDGQELLSGLASASDKLAGGVSAISGESRSRSGQAGVSRHTGGGNSRDRGQVGGVRNLHGRSGHGSARHHGGNGAGEGLHYD